MVGGYVITGDETNNLYTEYIYINDTWEELGTQKIDLNNFYSKTAVDSLLSNKVNKIAGKGLSTNDYTTAEKEKLAILGELVDEIMIILGMAEAGYLTFSGTESFTLGLSSTPKWDGVIEYSINRKDWSTWDGSTISSGVDNKLYLRGSGNTHISANGSTSNSSYFIFTTNGKISCTGRIDTLLDYKSVQNGIDVSMDSYCYYNLFYGCTSLTSAPKLPATTLARYCYRGMFSGCTSLTTPPDLPVTTLADGCYFAIFYGCTGLTSAPKLPATTLAGSCYYRMFDGCSSLTTAPDLPATTLAKSCYYEMFSKCTSLTTAPDLPATTLAELCYQGMFYSCTSLTTPPDLPATTLAELCYQGMFSGCTSLTTAPDLPVTTLAKSCYGRMFENCTSLTTPPDLPATALADNCYFCMFYRCTSIKLSETEVDNYTRPYRIPTTGIGTDASNTLTTMFSNTGGTFVGTPQINTTYYIQVPT